MLDLWWKDLVDELPPRSVIEERTSIVLAQARGWIAEFEERQAAKPQDILTSEEALAEWLREEKNLAPAVLRTGWPALDDVLQRPIRAGELVLIAARAGVGKTWALQAWIEETLRADSTAAAAIFELEMTAGHLAERLAVHALRQSPVQVRERAQRGLTVGEIMAAAPMLERLVISERSVAVDQLGEAIQAAAERLGRRPTIIAVDYLGLLRWDGSAQARTYERASENVKKLKAIATRERVVILAAAQLSREAGSGATRPTLASLRDSGVVEEAADRVIALWRNTPIQDENSKDEDPSGELQASVIKNRHGPTGGNVDLRFDASLLIEERPETPSYTWDGQRPESP
jgi:replicative DNA helicase